MDLTIEWVVEGMGSLTICEVLAGLGLGVGRVSCIEKSFYVVLVTVSRSGPKTGLRSRGFGAPEECQSCACAAQRTEAPV